MKVVIQRSKEASVSVDNKVVGAINSGFVILVGFTDGDTEKDIDYIIKKILNIRLFDDEFGVMNYPITKTNGSILSISQFTLYADTHKGNRPSYIKALNFMEAKKLYDLFNQKLSKYISVQSGIFGAEMQVNLLNDGPITIIIESGESRNA